MDFTLKRHFWHHDGKLSYRKDIVFRKKIKSERRVTLANLMTCNEWSSPPFFLDFFLWSKNFGDQVK